VKTFINESGAIGSMKSAWQTSSRYHSKIFHIVNQILLFIEIADRISRLI
jgi:hypothetical protein